MFTINANFVLLGETPILTLTKKNTLFFTAHLILGPISSPQSTKGPHLHFRPDLCVF